MKKLPILMTERLTLRGYNLNDAKELQRLVGEREIADMVTNIPHPYEDRMAEEWINTLQYKFDKGEFLALAISCSDTLELLGTISLNFSASDNRVSMGYWIAKEQWGKGYCTEAAEAMLEYGFVVLKLNRIYADHFARNPASGKVMQKIGMTKEGVLRQHVKNRWGDYEDLVCYGILRSEFLK